MLISAELNIHRRYYAIFIQYKFAFSKFYLICTNTFIDLFPYCKTIWREKGAKASFCFIALINNIEIKKKSLI